MNTGAPVGWLWIAPAPAFLGEDRERKRWLSQITVEEALRFDGPVLQLIRRTTEPTELAGTAAGRVWAADERDGHAHLSWRGGDGRWRHIGEQPPDGAELVTPTVEDGYLLLSHAAGAR